MNERQKVTTPSEFASFLDKGRKFEHLGLTWMEDGLHVVKYYDPESTEILLVSLGHYRDVDRIPVTA